MSMQPTPQRYVSPDTSPRRPRIILVGLIVLCGLFVYGYNVRLSELDQVQGKIVAMRAKVEVGKQKQAGLQVEFDDVGSDAYVEDMARDVLDYVRPGDNPVIMVKTTPVAPEAAIPGDEQDSPTPNLQPAAPVWQQWVDFFATDALHLR